MKNTFFEDIRSASKESNFTEAIAMVQKVLGQPNGDNAGMYFADDDEKAEENWEHLTHYDRVIILANYISHEINYELNTK